MAPVRGHSLHDDGMTSLAEYRRPSERTLLHVPDIDGYQTLKADLHMHTVFSDGLVWPTIRVQEAWQEGLDVIAITDHIEYQPHLEDIPFNPNRPYEIAGEMAAEKDILLIKGSEITRYTPPGHFNAIFVKDASEFVKVRERKNPELDKEAIDRAAAQDAFITWNHPGWKVGSIEGSYDWIPFVEEIHKEGKLHGIEVINDLDLHRKALDWALEHDLAVLGTSDIHNIIANRYDMEHGVHRSMTLLFVEERSLQGVREALEAGRSVAWSTRHLAGREKWVRALYEASVAVGGIYHHDEKGIAYAEIRNNSDLSFDLALADSGLKGWPETITLNPRSSQTLEFRSRSGTARYVVKNAYISGSEHLVVEISPEKN